MESQTKIPQDSNTATYSVSAIYYTADAYHPILEQIAEESGSRLEAIPKDKCFGEDDSYDSQLFLLDSYYLEQHGANFKNCLDENPNPFHSVILLFQPDHEPSFQLPYSIISNTFALPISESRAPIFRGVVKNALSRLREEMNAINVRNRLRRRSHELHEVSQIGQALATERQHDKLLSLILTKAKEISLADSGSLYLVETNPITKEKRLRFKLSSLNLDNTEEFTIPIDHNSIAGYVAQTGQEVNLVDAYHPPQDASYAINKSFDRATGYRTKSMLVFPMKNQKDETIGVLQLINRKPSMSLKLKGPQHIEEVVLPFDDNTLELISSIAGQAAVSIENNTLYKDIQRLFEGFVTASVTAIESRDPTTSGHSARVAELTVGLAEALNHIPNGPYGEWQFSEQQMLELRYASLLHDFGKVGVREKVLVKEKKLYPYDLDLIKSRFDFIKRTMQYETSQKKLRYIMEQDRQATLAELEYFDKEEQTLLRQIDNYLETIIKANEPTVMAEGGFDMIMQIAQNMYKDITGIDRPYITHDEATILSIRKGSLDRREREEIESHVTHTFKFLSQIPWTNELKRVPEIAYAHHEKLNGGGYPNGLTIEEIPLQSKIMTIADIFDSLTAADRPYKKAVPSAKALDILQYEVNDNHIDPHLYQIFLEAKIYERILNH